MENQDRKLEMWRKQTPCLKSTLRGDNRQHKQCIRVQISVEVRRGTRVLQSLLSHMLGASNLRDEDKFLLSENAVI